MRILSAGVALLVALAVSGPVYALEFRSISDDLTVLYDAPSKDSAKRLILTRGYPVEVIIASGDWVRVRDDKGTFAWVETGKLAKNRMVMVIAANVEGRSAADKSAQVVFKVNKGVVLEFVGVTGGWAKVRHHSGAVAFIRLGDLWGV